MAPFVTFSTWGELLDAIAAEYTLYYQGPMDYRPHVVQTVLRRDGKVRVIPVFADADPFTADAGHLGRFKELTA